MVDKPLPSSTRSILQTNTLRLLLPSTLSTRSTLQPTLRLLPSTNRSTQWQARWQALWVFLKATPKATPKGTLKATLKATPILKPKAALSNLVLLPLPPRLPRVVALTVASERSTFLLTKHSKSLLKTLVPRSLTL